MVLDHDRYLLDMSSGAGTWAQVRAAGIDDRTVDGLREVRNAYYQEYLRTESIEIDGVGEVLAELSNHARMAIVTTAKQDSARGLRSAAAAGIDCAVVHNEFTKSQDFSQAQHRIRTLAELPDIVLGTT